MGSGREAMNLVLDRGLAYATIAITYRSASIRVERILVDTGSQSTVLAADSVALAGIEYELGDRIETIRGVGGREFVFTRTIDRILLGKRELSPFQIEVGGMDYGFPINGILGMDFLVPSGAIIDLAEMMIRFKG